MKRLHGNVNNGPTSARADVDIPRRKTMEERFEGSYVKRLHLEIRHAVQVRVSSLAPSIPRRQRAALYGYRRAVAVAYVGGNDVWFPPKPGIAARLQVKRFGEQAIGRGKVFDVNSHRKARDRPRL